MGVTRLAVEEHDMLRRARTGVLVALLGAGTFAATATSPAQADGLRAHWGLDETGSPPAVAADDSGNGNDGQPMGGVVGDGSAFTFDGTGRVIVPDSPSLNPSTDDFSYTVTFTTGLPAAGTDYDLLRKGFAKTRGGEYKVEVLNVNGAAKGFCMVKDSLKTVARIRAGKGTLADGATHTITCAKTATGVSITVDSAATKTRTVSAGLGTVTNNADLTLGAKAASGGDWFTGSLVDATIR
jgi:hypothetical protein